MQKPTPKAIKGFLRRILSGPLVKKHFVDQYLAEKNMYRQLNLPGKMEHVCYKNYFNWLLVFLENKCGDYVELGAGSGATLSWVAETILENNLRRRNLIGFDTFSGYPKEFVSNFDKKTSGDLNLGSRQIAFEKIRATGYPQDKIFLHEGIFSQTVVSKTVSPESVALLNLDCNLYESYKFCLEYFYTRLPVGVPILFDEYKSPSQLQNHPGASRAIDDFFKCLSVDPEIIQVNFDDMGVASDNYISCVHFMVKK